MATSSSFSFRLQKYGRYPTAKSPAAHYASRAPLMKNPFPTSPASVRRPGGRRRSTAQPAARVPVPVFIAYHDVPAARRAMAQMSAWARSVQPGGELAPMLWRVDQLEAVRWREMASTDAARAAAVVFAGTSEESMAEEKAAHWLDDFAEHAPGPVSVLMLVGEDDAWVVSVQRPRGTVAVAAPRHRTAEAPAPELLPAQAA